MGFWSRRAIAPDRDMMAIVARRAVGWEVHPATGHAVLLVPRYRDPIFGRWLQPHLPEHKKYVRMPLDARGSRVWEGLDGSTPLGTICRDLLEADPDDGKDIHERTALYVYHLLENRLIEID